MNIKTIQQITKNNFCIDLEKTPIIPGDIICFTNNYKLSIFPVFKIIPSSNIVLVKTDNNNFKYLKLNASEVLNVSKKYNINPSKHLNEIKTKLINNFIKKRQLKYIFGYGQQNNKNIIFQLLIKKDENISDVLNKKCNFLENIYVYYNNSFIKYNNNITLFSYNKPIIISNNEFFIPTKATVPIFSQTLEDIKFYVIDLYTNNITTFNISNKSKISFQLIYNMFYIK